MAEHCRPYRSDRRTFPNSSSPSHENAINRNAIADQSLSGLLVSTHVAILYCSAFAAPQKVSFTLVKGPPTRPFLLR